MFLEPPLPQVAAAAVVAVVGADAGVEKPVHPAAQVTVAEGQDGQVEVVGHPAERQHPHRHPLTGIHQGLEEGVVVAAQEEHVAAGVAAVHDVVADAAPRGAQRVA